MERLAAQGDNSDSAYDAIFAQREQRGVDEFDVRRWQYLIRYFRGGRLIDLGTLDSLVPLMAKELYPRAEVWGMDKAEDAIKTMRERYPEVIYEVGDIYKTQFPTGYFSYVVLGEVLEHLEEPEKCLKEAFRILKSGGTLALSVPEEEAREPGAVDIRHLWSFSIKDVRELLGAYGKVKIKVSGSKWFPRYRYAWPIILGWCYKN